MVVEVLSKIMVIDQWFVADGMQVGTWSQERQSDEHIERSFVVNGTTVLQQWFSAHSLHQVNDWSFGLMLKDTKLQMTT